MDPIRNCAQKIVDEVYLLWKRLREEGGGFDSGFAVFYSPPVEHPTFLLVGDNPGGKQSDFIEGHARTLPSEHDYFAYDYRLAQRMRSIFEQAGLTEELKCSVKTNRLFFRTKDLDAWGEEEPALRREVEAFCESKVLEIVNCVKPRIVFFESLGAFERLKPHILQSAKAVDVLHTEHRLRPGATGRLYHALALDGHPFVKGMVCVAHPSSKRTQVTDDECLRIAEWLRQDFGVFRQR